MDDDDLKLTDEHAKFMQRNLRLAAGFMVFWPPIAFGLFLWQRGLWAMMIAAVVSPFMIYWAWSQQFGRDPRRWWFLWRGPIVVIRDFEKSHEANAWLDEVAPDRWKNIYIGCYKFERKSDATAFKLVFG